MKLADVKVGQKLLYSENGQFVRVEVLDVAREQRTHASGFGTRVSLRALESSIGVARLGPGLVPPIEKGWEWDAWAADGVSPRYAGWSLRRLLDE